jgi:hypothetical protein
LKQLTEQQFSITHDHLQVVLCAIRKPENDRGWYKYVAHLTALQQQNLLPNFILLRRGNNSLFLLFISINPVEILNVNGAG